MTQPAGSASSLEATGPAFIAILVPALNEERYIEACLASLAAQEPGGGFEILVLDGGSTDATRRIVTELARRSSTEIRLVDNPGRLQSAACNLGARVASPRATVLIRADAHALYPAGFLVTCARALAESGATSVVVPMRTVAEGGSCGSGLQRAIAATQNSRLGNGGSAHRTGGASGFVDHGHHAAFDRAFFLQVGGYDPWFTPNEDAELDHRASRAGGRIWMCGEASVTYFPRRSFDALAKQYFRHGAGRARTLLSHGLRPRLRQCAPLLILIGSFGGLLLVPVNPWFASIPGGYALACCGWGAVAAVRARDAWLVAVGPAAMTMHLSWAVGFLRTATAWPHAKRARAAVVT